MTWWDAVLFAVAFAALWSYNRSSELGYRVRRLEKRVDLLLGHLKVEIEDPLHHELRRLVGEGKKLEAIKRAREVTGLSLRAAKEAVEEIEREAKGGR